MTLALALAISGILASTPAGPSSAHSAPDMCAVPPPLADTTWMRVAVNGVTMRIPSYFVVSSSANYYREYIRDKVTIDLYVGHQMPEQPSMFVLQKCTVKIGDRPATFMLYTLGRNYLLLAQWQASDGIGIVSLWITTIFQPDLLALRQVFWSVQFAGFGGPRSVDPSCAKAQLPPPMIGDVLDTGVVSMLVRGAAPPLPTGNAIFEFAFDSTGGMGPLTIMRSSIPDSAVRRLAMIVGSNVKDQQARAQRFGVRVEIAPEGMVYSTLPVSACGAH